MNSVPAKGFKPRKRRNQDTSNSITADGLRRKGVISHMNSGTTQRKPLSDMSNCIRQEQSLPNPLAEPKNVPATTPSSTRVKAVSTFMNSPGTIVQGTNNENISTADENTVKNSAVARQRVSKRKTTRRSTSELGSNLLQDFGENDLQTEDPHVDYNNIEHSTPVGFSDSDGDFCVSDIDDLTDDSSDDQDEDHVPTALPDGNEANGEEFKEWCKKMIDEVPPEYDSLGFPDVVCGLCGAQMWRQERCNKQVTKGIPKFTLCCSRGKVQLPPVPPTPPYLLALYNDKKKGPSFRRCIRMYNSMFSFTSMGGTVDDSINKGGAPYIYRLNGQNHHQIGSLIPDENSPPKFCQLYIYDTENEVKNRMRWINVKNSHNVDVEVVEGLLKMLDDTNELVRYFRMARDRFKDDQIVDLKIILKQSRSESGRENHMTESDEVAAILVGDQDDTCGSRDVIVDTKIDGLTRISDIHPKLMALQYPLLFPFGEDGYHENIYYVKVPGEPKPVRDTVSQREFYAHKFMIRKEQGLRSGIATPSYAEIQIFKLMYLNSIICMTMRMAGRLYQQYVVDSFSAVEQSRLWYIRQNQTTLRNELYKHICDYMKEGDGDLSNVGRSYILPSSFVGSRRYMQQNFQDSLAVCRSIGHPDLFLTMTCNPMWQEVLYMMSLLPACKPSDCPDIIARVFKLKLEQLTNDIKKKNFFGKCIAVMYVVEWQKRGLPHVHMLIWLDGNSKKFLNSNVDKFVSAEIPNPRKDPAGYAAVKQFMIHGPCGLERPKSPCMRNKKCIRHFPKRYCSRTMFDQSGFPVYRRRKTKFTVRVRKATLDNQWVVPYNRDLLVRYQCHINIEICNRARCLKYLFKYCLKGSDRATVEIKSKKQSKIQSNNQCVDEINRFFDGRYVCGAEACHRMFAFDIHHRTVSVERLPFHLEGKKNCTYNEKEKAKEVVEREKNRSSKLEAFFQLCADNPEARVYTYDELPQHYVWSKKLCQWTPRLKKKLHIGRLSYTHHSTGELWYLRMLLSRIRGPTSFKCLRTVEGTVYETFVEACNALGLLDDDKEWHACLEECQKYGLATQIRQLFVQIIVNCRVNDIKSLWQKHWECMSDDILLQRRKVTNQPELNLPDIELQWFALSEIDKMLRAIGKSIKDFKQLPQPPQHYMNSSNNNLIIDETSYDRAEMLNTHEELMASLNSEQRVVYDAVLESIYSKKGGIFFVYGSGGCGKTYLWKSIISRLRSEGKIVLPVASSGIAATLMPGGRTAHSRFKIPILIDELSYCNIANNSDIAQLLKKTSLIIWDEAPMQHKHAFEALDRTLRDIMKSADPILSEKPFGGITILFGGDFRQILPVVSRGSRSDIVSACLTRSRLWDKCRLFQLKENMRLNKGTTDIEKQQIADFAKWVLNVGDGQCGLEDFMADNDDELKENMISIPPEFCINSDSKSIEPLIQHTFPDLVNNFEDPLYLSNRAILTPTNETVAHLNHLILKKIPGNVSTYYSADHAEELGGHDNEIDTEYPVEYLNSFTMPGLPLHELKLKTGVVVMLMRNLNQTLGLCNGTRLIVKRCLKNAIECEVIAGTYVGSRHFIPRMEMSPTDSKLNFKIVRRQFPLQVCYAMTINKSQGQSLEVVGLYLPKAVFTHGQLYVALSRVTSPNGIKLFIESDRGKTTNKTQNVVYHEVFYSLHT